MCSFFWIEMSKTPYNFVGPNKIVSAPGDQHLPFGGAFGSALDLVDKKPKQLFVLRHLDHINISQDLNPVFM